MKKLTNFRFATDGPMVSSRVRYGNLYGMCCLREFKQDIKNDRPLVQVQPCIQPKEINLYCICDSYLYLFIHSDSIFCGVNRVTLSRWGIDQPAELSLDTTKTNVLLIERTEGSFPYIKYADYTTRFLKILKKGPLPKKGSTRIIVRGTPPASTGIKINKLHNAVFNKYIEQNLEFNLLDYTVFDVFREIKAEVNYKIFGRTSKEVATIPGLPYLFLSETLGLIPGASSFTPFTNKQIKRIVDTLNRTCEYYRNAGFDFVCTSVIPNSVSIVDPGFGKYNDVIRRVQNHPDLTMPMLNIYDVFDTTKCEVYFHSDSHWNKTGFNIWVNEFNQYLKQNLACN